MSEDVFRSPISSSEVNAASLVLGNYDSRGGIGKVLCYMFNDDGVWTNVGGAYRKWADTRVESKECQIVCL